MKLKPSVSEKESTRGGQRGRHALARAQLIGRGKEFGFHSKCNEKPLEDVKLRSGMICFILENKTEDQEVQEKLLRKLLWGSR